VSGSDSGYFHQVRIFFYTKYDRQGASSRYRTYQYQDSLLRAGIKSRYHPLFSDAYLKERYTQGRLGSGFGDLYRRRWADMKSIGGCDLAVIEKELLPYFPATFERKAFKNARRVLLDYDDAVFANYQHHRVPLVRLLLRNKIAKLMSLADGVICGSRFLYDYALEHAKRAWLVPTVVDVEKYTLHDHEHDGLISIGWIGTPWSARYLPVVERAVVRVAREAPVRLIVVGSEAPEWEGVAAQSYPWSEEKEADWIRWMDIGIMPLVDSPFERGKCGLKLIQYMAAGVVPVASDVGGNRDLIAHGEDGFLCKTEDEWVECLLALSRDPVQRAAVGKAARLKAESQYSLSVWAPKLAAIYREVGEAR
jgi:glycosyltransferase involved in cell wall biosynthesis